MGKCFKNVTTILSKTKKKENESDTRFIKKKLFFVPRSNLDLYRGDVSKSKKYVCSKSFYSLAYTVEKNGRHIVIFVFYYDSFWCFGHNKYW